MPNFNFAKVQSVNITAIIIHQSPADNFERTVFMNRNIHLISAFLILSLGCASVSAVGATNPYIGRWALTIPGGGAGWLGVTEEGGSLKAHILWGGGSVVPTSEASMDGDTLKIIRIQKIRRRDAKGKVIRTDTLKETTNPAQQKWKRQQPK